MRKRIAMEQWIEENGWVGLFKHLLKNGVLRIDDEEDPLEGPDRPQGQPDPRRHRRASYRRRGTSSRPAWAGVGAALHYDFDADQLRPSTRRAVLCGAGLGRVGGRGALLAVALHRKHDCGLPARRLRVQECPEATEQECLGTLDRAATFEEGQRVEARWDGTCLVPRQDHGRARRRFYAVPGRRRVPGRLIPIRIWTKSWMTI